MQSYRKLRHWISWYTSGVCVHLCTTAEEAVCSDKAHHVGDAHILITGYQKWRRNRSFAAHVRCCRSEARLVRVRFVDVCFFTTLVRAQDFGGKQTAQTLSFEFIASSLRAVWIKRWRQDQ
eukprot:6214477-Pleurochrysis_carterae.AAC.2